jgi:hypothetical protein
MVRSVMAASQARDRLLAAAVERAMRGGIADLSLRELAAGASEATAHIDARLGQAVVRGLLLDLLALSPPLGSAQSSGSG